MNTKVVLTMIVKDEEHVIKRALSSCYQMIDSYCIIDTGSTDKTKEVIKDFFDSKNIEGKIIDFEFTNFEECRNLSITEAKGLGDYGFWMDADEELVLKDTFNKTIFSQFLATSKLDQFQILCYYGGMNYFRSQFYSLSHDFYWYGPVHEVLKSDTPIKTGQFDFGHMKITPDGNSWKTDDLSKKYQDHAEILLKYQEDNDWKDSRWTFYLAQSYKDASNIRLGKDPKDELGIKLAKKAIQYFTERVKVNSGFYQETFYSQLMLARQSFHTNTDEFVFQNLIKCEELNVDKRVEHLFNIGSFLQNSQLHKNALMYLKIALKYLKEGTKASLFKEQYIYDWAIYDMYAISLFYTGNPQDALKYFKYALKKAENANARDIDLERVRNNVKSVELELQKRNNANGTGNITK
tara:strand:+ start:277 stop:1500 length:1224 start_codon:yes stop_codon:yes gene_type:complete